MFFIGGRVLRLFCVFFLGITFSLHLSAGTPEQEKLKRIQNQFLKPRLLDSHFKWIIVLQALIDRDMVFEEKHIRSFFAQYLGYRVEKIRSKPRWGDPKERVLVAWFEPGGFIFRIEDRPDEIVVYIDDATKRDQWDNDYLWYKQDYAKFEFKKAGGVIESIKINLRDVDGKLVDEMEFTARSYFFGDGPFRHSVHKRKPAIVPFEKLYKKGGPARISFKEAQRISQDKTRAIVGVFDLGVDYNLPQIAHKLLPLTPLQLQRLGYNQEPTRSTGWDFEEQHPFPYDHGYSIFQGVTDHGSAVISVLTFLTNEIAVLPFRGPKPAGTSVPDAIRLAYEQGARIFNLSMASDDPESWKGMQTEIQNHPDMIFVVAAGNDGKSQDEKPNYPAAFPEPNIIAVASIDSDLKLSGFSSFCPRLVDICAPGSAIQAIRAGGEMGYLSGTSFAAPYVAKVLALLWKRKPELTAIELIQAMKLTATRKPELVGKIESGIINPWALFEYFKTPLPDALKLKFNERIAPSCSDGLADIPEVIPDPEEKLVMGEGILDPDS